MPKAKVPHDPETGEIQEPLGSREFLRSLGYRPVNLDDNGHELLDSTPMAPPIGYKPEPSMVEIIRAQIRSAQLAEEAEAAGMETFEEADDFDIDDDFDPSSPYEEMFDPPPAPPRWRTAQEEMDERRPHRQPVAADPPIDDPDIDPPPQKAPKKAPAPSRTPKAPDPVLDGPEG